MAFNEEQSASHVNSAHSARKKTHADEKSIADQSNLSRAGGGQTGGTSQTDGRVHFAPQERESLRDLWGHDNDLRAYWRGELPPVGPGPV